MVLKKRLDCGFNGYPFPVVPRAPRSRRGSFKKSVDSSHICAFELLAAVAGKLLQESESFASSNAAEGKNLLGIHRDGIKLEKLEEARSECIDQGSCIESVVPELASQKYNLKSALREVPHCDDSGVGHTSIASGSDFSKKVGSDMKLNIFETNNSVENSPTNAEGGSSNRRERQLEDVGKHAGDLTIPNTCSLKDAMGIPVNTCALINPGNHVQLPLYRNPVTNTLFPKHTNNVKVGIRDDVENSFRFNRTDTKKRAFRRQSRIGYRRIRKMLTSKYWKVAPKLKDCELSHTDERMKPSYRNRKLFCMRGRGQHEAPSKRQKLCGHGAKVAYDLEASSESISNSLGKHMSGATGVSSSTDDHNTSFQSEDSHVAFSIKSFKVPELYIEVPETATVGSLKRTVKEAVNAILRGGLRVGVLLQGKKVRDDSSTLLQTGISHACNVDTLGFTLEPSFTQASLSPRDLSLLLPCDADKLLSSSPTSPKMDSRFSEALSDSPPLIKIDKHAENYHELVPRPTNLLAEGTDPESKALVPAPPISVEALTAVPMCQRNKRTEFSQRRTRRPFSVSEVEALVESVEQLGTGRWRDVKMRSFDDANHRTYVDLKDKWKTLVHTASISPQQRRGEPVPQELLDRVLAAHSYWSRHQAKQNGKLQTEPTLKILDAGAEGL